ncbi:hypothetical protein V492_05778, partial [Pseudogymnoascus sp. VKM F-4246]
MWQPCRPATPPKTTPKHLPPPLALPPTTSNTAPPNHPNAHTTPPQTTTLVSTSFLIVSTCQDQARVVRARQLPSSELHHRGADLGWSYLELPRAIQSYPPSPTTEYTYTHIHTLTMEQTKALNALE